MNLQVEKAILQTEAELSRINLILDKLLWEAQTNRRTQNVIRNSLVAPIFVEIDEFVKKFQLTFEESLSTIIDEELSLTRFGDGEFKLLLRSDYNLAFQRNEPGLQSGLKQVLEEPVEGLLVGFPYIYRDQHWQEVWSDVWFSLKPFLDNHTRFANSHISRPIFFQYMGEKGVKMWRNVWEKKKVTVITGENSRFEAIPELFDNVSSLERIDSTPTNAFNDLSNVLSKVANDTSDILLVSLGPAGTVLSHQLAKQGRRALDIGHISDSYINVFKGGKWPEKKPVAK
ncbi:hypothetical protein BSR29_00520 [Boudabousia liubingyangii]|uniref:Glycosyltransferase GT-D fold domain-containing protein n=1 Tax=Boudabousia liubingyangii TaxID=1921764 RepID=A0A1Q5PPG3_9ACTO|nr:GT-D fold domain-containing glycosyltransferase [Boudabousia liubingyangii]OKL49481.1 hypothetical protein BSR29_00520 [Boudabousia liubingyangii]